MIDIWSVIAISIPFLEVLLHTYLNYVRKQKNDAEMAKRGNLHYITLQILFKN